MTNVNKDYEYIQLPVLNKIYSDKKLKKLYDLSNQSEINLFNKNNNLKNKNTLIKESHKLKKEHIKQSSVLLSNLAKLCPNDSICKIKNINENLENKINKIDEFINCISEFDEYELKKNCIEYFSN